ncbi:MAG TPA: patatin-like phospholipase family protein [Nitrosopumilaceae archaeon]|nr:patatin-like phospholipase family protein [Nitrosopumilaceae archaeon]
MEYETVLVLQGGGSLGAYECGVYKTLYKHKIKFDIVAGTSIGGINAAIIAGNKNDEPAKSLEDFWLTLAETATPSLLADKARAFSSAMYSAMWGNSKVFQPIWFMPNSFNFLNTYPYLYDLTPLKKTLKDFVDFTKIKNPDRPRLLVTSTDVQSGESTVFDSKYVNFTPEHVLAGAGYPFYGISWTKINDRYLWDGTLLSNTPLTEVIDASPKCDKRVFLVNLFPHDQEEIPKTMIESLHRARDIMHTDKTDHTIRMSKVISGYLELLKEMHDIIMENFDAERLDEKSRERFKKLEHMYHKLAVERGTIIKEIIRIERKEDSQFLFEDADFSLDTIKQLIQNGEKDAENVLANYQSAKT